MSMSPEDAQRFKNEPAVLCCRKEAGSLIDESSLEEPAILPDLESSGLLTIPENAFTIEQAMGKKLIQTVEALTPLTPDLFGEEPPLAAPTAVEAPPENRVTAPYPAAAFPADSGDHSQSVKVRIGKGEDIFLEIPLGANLPALPSQAYTQPGADQIQPTPGLEPAARKQPPAKKLVRKYFPIEKVVLAPETRIEGNTLYLRENIAKEAAAVSDLVTSLKLEVIDPDNYDHYSETIIDVQPIATKEGESPLGTGTTRALDGVVMLLTGTDEDGVQIGEFGSTEGFLSQTMMWGRPGAPDKGDILIKAEVVIRAKMNMERQGPYAAHQAIDYITEEIRKALKEIDGNGASRDETLEHTRNPAGKKILIVKEIMGQGAMHDNTVLPREPCGVAESTSIIDLGNLPVVLSPLEALDGGIHAMVCVGPASKETTRHYWREPLIMETLADPDLDLAGVVFVGSPQLNREKYFVSERLGMLAEAMDLDGIFIGTEGFGNNHIDFALHHNQMGIRGIPVVGITFSAVQGALVMGNEHMTNMIELNKSAEGIENEILCNNTLCTEDAVRAVAMLKAVMAGEEIKAAEPSYNRHVKAQNLELISNHYGREIELVENESILPPRMGRPPKEANK